VKDRVDGHASKAVAVRIGVLTTSYPRYPDDPAGSFVAEHVRWLQRYGCQVDVVCAGTVPGRIRAGSALFYGEGAPDRLARRPGMWGHAGWFAAALTRQVWQRAASWDRIVAHWLAPCGLAAALAGRGVPLVAVAHSGDVHLLERLGLSRAAGALFAHRRARLVFVSEALRSGFVRHVAGRPLQTTVCPMGVDVARFARARASRPAPRPGAPARILFLGRLVPVKGAAYAVAAIAHMRRPAELIVAGAGPERAALTARAGSSVRLVGEVTGRERDALVAAADAVVVPSIYVEGGRTEGTPLAALEAMAAGVPVVASRLGGLAEIPARAIRWAVPADPADLARAIDHVLEDSAAQVAAAREWVAARDWPRVAARLMRLIECA
jgi:glycosyltransferase involved in cell wall biosynthesis